MKEVFALMLASQALYNLQLFQVLEALKQGDVEEAAWLAAGYAHHPELEKREVYQAPAGGWRFLLDLLAEEALTQNSETSALYTLAYVAHLGEATAVYATYQRRGMEQVLKLAEAILQHRPMVRRYGLHAVSRPVGGRKTRTLSSPQKAEQG